MDIHSIFESLGIAETAVAPAMLWLVRDWWKNRTENKELRNTIKVKDLEIKMLEKK